MSRVMLTVSSTWECAGDARLEEFEICVSAPVRPARSKHDTRRLKRKVKHEPPVPETLPEPVPCMGQTAVYNDDGMPVDVVRVGDVVLVRPDGNSREADQAVKYLLPLSMGEVRSSPR